MRIFRSDAAPFRPADLASFVGAASTQLLGSADEGASVHLYHVRFQDGARTNWHTHSGPQWLFIVEGQVRVQRQGGAPEDVTAGDAVLFPPNERHWHGARPGSRGAHLAVNVNVTTTWLEPVGEAEYRGR
jgi:quercetin dioxygenase-like cupin family protein